MGIVCVAPPPLLTLVDCGVRAPPMEPAEESPLAARVAVLVWVCCWGTGAGAVAAASVGAAAVCELVV